MSTNPCTKNATHAQIILAHAETNRIKCVPEYYLKYQTDLMHTNCIFLPVFSGLVGP